MIARISYAFRETWASFKRNVTLTMAAVITSAVSLLLVGSTFLIQRAFDNLLTRWKGDVELIVYVRSDADPNQIQVIEDALKSQPSIIDVTKLRYLDQAESYAEACSLPRLLGNRWSHESQMAPTASSQALSKAAAKGRLSLYSCAVRRTPKVVLATPSSATKAKSLMARMALGGTSKSLSTTSKPASIGDSGNLVSSRPNLFAIRSM